MKLFNLLIIKRLKIGKNKVIIFSISNDSKKFAKKLGKLKNQKLFKS